MSENNVDDLFANSTTAATIRRLARELDAAEQLNFSTTSSYVSVRPRSVEHIAVFLLKNEISIALDPNVIQDRKAALTGSEIEAKTDSTHYLHIPAEAVEEHFERTLSICIEAIQRAVAGPDFTSKPGAHQNLPEAKYCEKCFMQLPNTGICESPSCA